MSGSPRSRRFALDPVSRRFAMETMLALVKKEAKPGLWLDEVPVAPDRDQRRAHQGAAHRDLRY